MPARVPASSQNGLPFAVVCYIIWGLLPLYLRQVHDVPALEFVGWRTLFTLPVCLVLILALRQAHALRATLRQPKTLLWLAASATLIFGNWLTYVIAIQQGHVFASSLGYYINPLINVLLGTMFLGERLGRAQWVAVGLAALGVAILASGAGATLGISMALAITFSLYGLVRKQVAVAPLPGLAIETAILTLPAIALVWFGHGPEGVTLNAWNTHSMLVACAGIVTAVPLVLFAYAAQRMDYSLLGFVQFIAPTIVFFLGLFLFHEALRPVQLGCFVLIWLALAVFCWDLWQKRKAA
jgi:chloramphenicol-sensitive protein RarD